MSYSVPPFPVRGRVVTEWSSISKPVLTFSNYVVYVRTDRHYLELPSTWENHAVKNIVDGLKLAGKGTFRPPNFIRSELIAKIAAYETRDGDFAQLSFLSFLYALRVRSSALVLRRAFKYDDVTGKSPMADQVLIGLRGEMRRERLIIRFARRKNPQADAPFRALASVRLLLQKIKSSSPRTPSGRQLRPGSDAAQGSPHSTQRRTYTSASKLSWGSLEFHPPRTTPLTASALGPLKSLKKKALSGLS